MRSAVMNQLAQKSMRLSPKAQIQYTSGQRTSALGVDCKYIELSFPDMVDLLIQPLTIVVGFILLVINLGPSALVVRMTCL